ncbi:hypothetical protein PCIT_a2278 [Pseudoalteromonas citrea]|uniref:Uncharacterized protein n=1 Tax=Pseudoalteromonas citrea TaxID=43655 RepID=A0AAD4AJS6_9GAMM|nr:hypothetical protein PCIT_a2278 [Pseudoalteromonas citrea]
MVADIKLPLLAGLTWYCVANTINKGCGAYNTKNVKREQLSNSINGME